MGMLEKMSDLTARAAVAMRVAPKAAGGDPFASEKLLTESVLGREESARGALRGWRRANPNARSEGGDTALHLALEKGMRELAKDLLKAGADVSAKNKEWKTPLEAGREALERAKEDPAKAERISQAIESLLGWLNGPAERIKEARGPAGRLQAAAWRGDFEQAQRLVGGGADPNARPGGDGTLTALMLASEAGHWDVAAWLAARGANLEERVREDDGFRSDRHTALGLAAKAESLERCLRLMDLGASGEAAQRVFRFGDEKQIKAVWEIPSGEEIARVLKERMGEAGPSVGSGKESGKKKEAEREEIQAEEDPEGKEDREEEKPAAVGNAELLERIAALERRVRELEEGARPEKAERKDAAEGDPASEEPIRLRAPRARGG